MEATRSGIILFKETLSTMIEKAMQWYFKATLVNIHDDLVNAWAYIAQSYLNGQIDEYTFKYLVRKLTDPFPFKDPLTGGTVTFTLEYAMKINNEVEKADVNQKLVNEWESGARNKYYNVIAELQDILSGRKTITPTETTPGQSSTTESTPVETTPSTPGKPSAETATTPSGEEIRLSDIIAIVVILVLIAIIVVVYVLKK